MPKDEGNDSVTVKVVPCSMEPWRCKVLGGPSHILVGVAFRHGLKGPEKKCVCPFMPSLILLGAYNIFSGTDYGPW